MSPLDFGYLIGVLDSDGSVYHESRPGGGRRATIDIETSDLDVARRVADLLGAPVPYERTAKPRGDIDFRQPTYRVRLRGRRAEKFLAEAIGHLSPRVAARAAEAIAATRPSTCRAA